MSLPHAELCNGNRGSGSRSSGNRGSRAAAAKHCGNALTTLEGSQSFAERINQLSKKRRQLILPIQEHPREYVLPPIRDVARNLRTDRSARHWAESSAQLFQKLSRANDFIVGNLVNFAGCRFPGIGDNSRSNVIEVANDAYRVADFLGFLYSSVYAPPIKEVT
ncbi:MAG: hypothetical protein WAM69_15715 [Candidatus Sulfotelmatobacter sp.]